ncbi:hypothetical protein DQ239_14960 [Blastococcus sp. TF02-09]|nr:hypothetical protein DQ239_14960 [Blastococcus sp. TF02-9]
MPEEVVAHLAAGIRELADSLGFPEPLNRAHIGDFDRPATALVHDRMAILPSDAASEEVWNFLSLVVLPDVSVWRWPARAEERLLGRPRNVLRRLWWRAEVVGVDLINCADGLGEDELVNIMERPTLAADRRLAQLIGDAIVKSPRVNVARSEVMRDLAKRMLRTQGAFCLDVLTEQDLTVVVQRAMRQSLVALGLPLDKSKPVVELPPPAPTHVPQHADAPPQFTVDRGVPTWAVVYVPGEAHGKASPANCRFRPDSPLATRYVTRYFESLIRTEAPVHLETLYQSFRRDWDVDPYVGNMPEALDRALRRSSIGGQRVSVGADGFVRVPGQSVDVVRVPYDEDPRPPHRVPPEEIRLAVQHLHDELPDATAELLAARLSALFGWPSEAEARRRMGETVGT